MLKWFAPWGLLKHWLNHCMSQGDPSGSTLLSPDTAECLEQSLKLIMCSAIPCALRLAHIWNSSQELHHGHLSAPRAQGRGGSGYGAQQVRRKHPKGATQSLQLHWQHKRRVWGVGTEWKWQNSKLFWASENTMQEKKDSGKFWSSTWVGFFFVIFVLLLFDVSPFLLIFFSLHWKYALSSSPSSVK